MPLCTRQIISKQYHRLNAATITATDGTQLHLYSRFLALLLRSLGGYPTHVLIGLFVAVPYERGSMMQLSLATVCAALYLVVQLVARPYRQQSTAITAGNLHSCGLSPRPMQVPDTLSNAKHSTTLSRAEEPLLSVVVRLAALLRLKLSRSASEFMSSA